jgi:hypothetical protein
MPDDEKTGLGKDAEGLEEGDLSEESSVLDGSGDEGVGEINEDLLEDAGITLDDIPEGARDALTDALAKVSKYLQDTREDESAKFREATEKALEYDQLMANPRLREMLLGTLPGGPIPPKEKEPETYASAYSERELETALAGDPAALASYLRDNAVSIARAEAKAAVESLRESDIAPLSQKATIQEVSAQMESQYGKDWKKDIPKMRAYIQLHPQETDIEAIYLKAVEVPRLRSRLAKNEGGRNKKKSVLGKTPEGVSKGAGKTASTGTEKKKYATTREAVADTLAQLERGGAEGK